MKIRKLWIQNYKSINDLTLDDIETALILVEKQPYSKYSDNISKSPRAKNSKTSLMPLITLFILRTEEKRRPIRPHNL